ncbi:UBR4 [Lepeophtheirus salmonis]|uniref:UBR4 n=1 Tax=Lepeophtheirus salmonis TaxID=72036 RepID=A0A7R8CRL2_LEPSM|nr:UBR4 [Lepeophtheirus salmonis]CAF2906398.1 UBR4 [Lepeophtheirus salmonis]
MDDLCTMHNLILAPRTNHKVLGPWIKDALVKQGLTTAKAEALIKSISTTVNSLNYDVNLFKSFFEKLKGKKGFIEAKRGQILKSKDMPSFFDLLLLDSDQQNSSKTEGESPTEHLPIVVSTAHDLVPLVLQAVESLSVCAKSLVLDSISGSKFDIMALQRCLSVSGVQCLKTVCLPRPIQDNYPKSLLSALEEWNGTSLDEYPPILCWRTQFNNTPSFPSESYITSIISVNVSGIRQNNIIHCLKHCLYIAALFTGELLPLCNDFSLLQYDLVRVLFPLILDATTNNLSELIALNLKILVGAMDSVQFLVKVYNHVLTNTYPILLPDTENIDTDTKEEQEEGTERYVLNEKILEDIVQYMEIMLETHMGRGTLDKFFRENDLIKILLSISTRGPRFASKVLKFFNQLYQLNEKNSSEGSVQRLCSTLSKLAEIPNKHLEEWLNYLVTGMYCQLESAKSSDEYLCLQENRALLQSLTNYIVKEENSVSEDVAFTILKCLIPMGSLLLFSCI